MKIRARISHVAAAITLAMLLVGCGAAGGASGTEFSHPDYDTDFSEYTNPGFIEGAYTYQYFFLPDQGSGYQSFVGDPMPYYEDGTYYLYYLKDGGNSFHHSIFLTTTTDFLTFTDYPDPILEASPDGGQDGWIGTGSVVKVGETYYFFYTGHAGSEGFEYQEKIMVAAGTSPTEFTKVDGWELVPPDEIGQKRDFRDPQAYYDPERDVIELTVTAASGGVARIVKFTLSADLTTSTYDGIILTDPIEAFYNLECSDTFKIGDTYYITYSGQDDTLWYATSKTPYGPYDEPRRIDDKLFYAAKHVEDGENCYLVGWLRRSETTFAMDEVSAWGGNLVVQQVCQAPDGSLYLQPVDAVRDAFADRRELSVRGDSVSLSGGAETSYTDVFTAYERFLITGEFTFTGDGDFGLAFDWDGDEATYKLISVRPSNGSVALAFEGGGTVITTTDAQLTPGETYTFTYLQEGSCGVFYIDGVCSLAVRLYGVSGKPARLFAQNNTVEFSNLREYTAPPADAQTTLDAAA